MKYLADHLKVSQRQVREEIRCLKLQGYNILRSGSTYEITSIPSPEDLVHDHRFFSDETNMFTFGVCSDAHLASKYERLDVLNDLYDIFESVGISNVYSCGNYVEGECRLNKHDISVSGMDNQLEYLADNYPRRSGITTYSISGDDHEGWWAKDKGVNIGRHTENIMRNNGREDWVDLGYIESFVPLVNAKSGKKANMLLMHPGGGSSYAISYRPQKIVESLTGGEKPDILLIGHYHKLSYNYIRNVHTIQAGCTQDQSPFLRKKGIEPHIGGIIVQVTQNPKTGRVMSLSTQFLIPERKGTYNGRWTYSGNVNKQPLLFK